MWRWLTGVWPLGVGSGRWQVKAVRFITKGTIEERILELQV